MRVDPKSRDLPLSPKQRFFVSCWFNMVHQHSLDSHRVRTMNPRNILREMLRLHELPHANEEDRAMVSREARLVLSSDPVLKRPPMASTNVALLELMDSDGKGKGKPNHEALTGHVARELFQIVDASYVDSALALLAEILRAEPSADAPPSDDSQLSELTCGLLSSLIDGGASLESLFQMYRQILVPLQPARRYVFERKLAVLTAILKQQPKAHRVIFSIDNVTNAADFPSAMGGIQFSSDPHGWIATTAPVASYLTRHSRRLFAELVIEARDIRAAGTEAYARIGNVLDLARFEHERERVQLADEFLALTRDRPDRVRRYPIPKVVPNPDAIAGSPDLGAFVSSVDKLLSSEKFAAEGRERILSAFRLYRLGADTNSFENKLANWWTAVEFLVRGLKGGKQIATTVEQNVTPVLCLAYPRTLLLDVRHTLVKAGITLTDPATAAAIDLHGAAPSELYGIFIRADVQPRIVDALSSEPYLQWRIRQILDAFAQPGSYLPYLRQHEQRIRWQIQRLWRARCDIVHSARRTVSDVLLCANLEFYLKVTLMSLLAELRRVKTLSSPEEFFERQTYAYERLLADLSAGSVAVMKATLTAD